MSHYRKKNIINIGVLCCPPPYPLPSPQENRDPIGGPTFASSRSFNDLNLISPYYLHHLIPDLYYHFPLCIHLLLLPIPPLSLLPPLSIPSTLCHHVMSLCHVILSYNYVILSCVILSCHLVIYIHSLHYKLNTTIIG